MAKRLFVGNLPYDTTEEDLRSLFTPYAEPSYVKIITDRETGRSKGFGFVELEDAAADKAIAELNGKDMGEGDRVRQIVVNEARPMEDRGSGGGGGGFRRRDFGGGDRGGRSVGGDR